METVKKYAAKTRGVKSPNKGHRIIVRIKSPDGIIIEYDGLKRFCRKYNLHASSICRLLHGQGHTYKGWTRP